MAEEVTKQVIDGATVTTTTFDGKGSGPRDHGRRICTDEEFRKNWDRTFGKKRRAREHKRH